MTDIYAIQVMFFERFIFFCNITQHADPALVSQGEGFLSFLICLRKKLIHFLIKRINEKQTN